ncbi:VTT domain-containing protein [Crocinitomicaceae bacterium]|nr:VTT domain-containing protein [Crocinitomicaceae bacterium]
METKKILSSASRSKWSILNRYYKITNFYAFLKQTAFKGGIILAILLIAFFILDYYFLDTHVILDSLVANYSPFSILSIFYASETIVGILPPEMFIAWSSKMPNPVLYLFILASLSYLGGAAAYWLGKLVGKITSIQNRLENRIAKHITNLRKWGGFFVVIGALLPLPHAIVSFACGLIKYDFKNYLLWALFRFVRFAFYGWLIFGALG